MDDLLLWRLLDAEELDADALVPLLAELARVPALARAPWLGKIGRVLHDPSAALRASGIAALADATGPLAVREIVRALDDGEPRVREAAVEAIRSVASVHPLRFAHALFHREPAVRAAALRGPIPLGTSELVFRLLADPESAAVVEALDVRPGPGSIGVVLDFVRAGRVASARAQRWIASMPVPDQLAWAATSPSRSADDVARVLASEGLDRAGHDPLDELFTVLAARGDDAARARFFHAWTEQLRSSPDVLSRRVVAALVVAMHRTEPSREPLGLAVNHDPELLGWRSFPRAARAAAIDAIYREGPRRAVGDAALERLAACDLAHRTHGGIDLRFLGALLCFRRTERYAWLVDRLGLDAIADAFFRDPEHAAPFLAVPDRSSRGRAWVVGELLSRAHRDARPLLRAISLVHADGDPSLLSGMPDEEQPLLFEQLLGLEHHASLGYDEERAKVLAHALVRAGGSGDERALLEAWLRRADHAESALGRSTLKRIGQTFQTEAIVDLIASLPVFILRRTLAIASTTDVLTLGQERALAERLVAHTSPRVAEWAEARVPSAGESTGTPFSAAPGVTPIPSWLATQIRTAIEVEDGTVQRCHGAPCIGLVAALSARTDARPSVAVAVALLGAHDPLPDVARALAAWTSDDPRFLSELDAAVVKTWCRRASLPLAANAWMWRFDQHGFAAADAMIERGLATTLREALSLASPLLTQSLWAAAANAFGTWRYGAVERLSALADDALLDLLVEQLDTPIGSFAARMLVSLVRARAAPGAIEARYDEVRARLPDLADDVRGVLSDFVTMDGLPSRPRGARAMPTSSADDLLARIAKSDDLDELARHCRSIFAKIVHEAALRLVMIGDAGCRRIATLLAEEPPPTHLEALSASIALWPEGDAVKQLERLLAMGTGTSELRFRIALGLVERGDHDAMAIAIECARADDESHWLTRKDFERLWERAPDHDALACALAISPHPHAYIPAIEHLVKCPIGDDELAALRAFLAKGTDRARPLRTAAALRLHREGDFTGFPVLASAALGRGELADTALFAGVPLDHVLAIVEGVLYAGGLGAESALVAWLDTCRDRAAVELGLERLLAVADDVSVRAAAVQRLPHRPTRAAKLRALAETFAWGTAVGRELTGRVVRIHLISSNDFGYTRLRERRIFVTPLPIVRGERRGREVVEGLILHELGHQRYHGGPSGDAVWRRADQAGLGRLLNLVADEHLERNLRAMDASYGDRLKRLAAFAFQHAAREVELMRLLDLLGARAFSVLIACRLGPARAPTCVQVETGSVLGELERAGSSFAKFVRALRMGLGHRHGDAKVEEALALFDRGFKKSDMERLYALTQELHRIFADEISLVTLFGGAESLEDSLHDRATHGEGIADDDVQQEVERILGPPGDGGTRRREGRPPRLAINVAEDDHFDVIHEIVQVSPSPELHRKLAHDVARHARRLRTYLTRLGLAYEPVRMRLAGRRLDTTRIRPLVTHGDPRIMLARQTRLRTDLHLAIVIDCSGSMQGPSMDRAHAFGVLLAEAVRGLHGVDLRIWGFDDKVIFDAGDARRPAVTSLEAGAGNNDAAGLYHAAKVALTSRRRAKLVVMISDGLPTECSVAALRGLVRTLTRRHHVACAQVAVRPLEEQCFPHYVEVNDENHDAAVRRFGVIIAGLVGRTLGA